ncbi:MAG: rhomboid family intramembrane serine protease [Candidatus Eisenbacteria bacterium]
MSQDRPPEPRREAEAEPDSAATPAEPTPEDFAVWDPGFVPPDPDEPPPVELWRAVGDITPWGTLFVLLPCTLLFLVLAVRAHDGWQADLYVWGGNATHLPLADSSWRVLASMFLHSGAPHLFFNATTLLLFGPAVERLFTRHAFWVVYALGGACASLASLAWRDAHGGGYSVGASGAIFALAGALLVGAYRLRHRLAVGRARSLGAAILYLAGTGFAAGFARHGTDNVAHAGGLVCGALLASRLGLRPELGGRGAGGFTRALARVCALALAAAVAIGVRDGLSVP